MLRRISLTIVNIEVKPKVRSWNKHGLWLTKWETAWCRVAIKHSDKQRGQPLTAISTIIDRTGRIFFLFFFPFVDSCTDMHVCAVFSGAWNKPQKTGFHLKNATVPSKFRSFGGTTAPFCSYGPHAPPKSSFSLLELKLACAATVSNNNSSSLLLSVDLPMGKVALCSIKFVAVLSF